MFFLFQSFNRPILQILIQLNHEWSGSKQHLCYYEDMSRHVLYMWQREEIDSWRCADNESLLQSVVKV